MINNEIYLKDIEDIKKAPLPWDKIKEKNVLITGATGLIGSCIVDLLMCLGNVNVFAMGRSEFKAKERFFNYLNSDRFFFLCHDISKELDIDINFDYIIHAASIVNPKGYNEQPVETMISNFLGTYNLLEYARKKPIKRFMFISSSEVYGEDINKEVEKFDEDYSGYVNPTNVSSSYASSKRATENLMVSYKKEYNIDGVIVRPCHVYGPTMAKDDSKVIFQFIRSALNGEDILLKSSGKQVRVYTYVTDIVSAVFYVLFLGESGEAYNISSDDDISIRELAEKIADFSGVKVIFSGNDSNEKKVILNNKKISNLGWKSKVSLDEGLCKTIEILKQNNK